MTTKTTDQPGDLVMGGVTDARAIEVLREMRDDGGIVDDAEWVAAVDHAIAALSAQPRPDSGLELAAKFVDQRREDYDSEHGGTDPETGTREYPGTGDEYVGELHEIAEGIRAIQQPASAPVGVCQSLKLAAAEEQAGAWQAVCELLTEIRPGWAVQPKLGIDCALGTIRALAQQPAAEMSREAGIEMARTCAYFKRDSHGYLPQTEDEARDWMPHEWVIDAIRQKPSPATQPAAVEPGCTWCEPGQKECSMCQPDTALRSIYDLLGVNTESDAGAEIARLHIIEAKSKQPASVDEAWTDAQCLAFAGCAFRHAPKNLPEGVTLADIRIGAQRALAQPQGEG